MTLSSILILKSFLVPLHCATLHFNHVKKRVKLNFRGFAREISVSLPIITRKNPDENTLMNEFRVRENRHTQNKKEKKLKSEHKNFKTDGVFVKGPEFTNKNQQPELSKKAKPANTGTHFERGVNKINSIGKKLLRNINNSNIAAVKRAKDKLSVVGEDLNKGMNQIDPTARRVHEKIKNSIRKHVTTPILRVPSDKRNKATTESDDSHGASVMYNFGSNLHIVHIDLNDFAKLFSDVLFFYKIQLKFFILFEIHKSIVKIPRMFIPKTFDDLITLYIYTESILTRDYFEQVLENYYWAREQRKKKEGEKQKLRNQQQARPDAKSKNQVATQKQDSISETNSIYRKLSSRCIPELEYLKTVCNNVYNTLKNNQFPNNKIPDLINKQSFDKLRTYLFDILNSKNILASNVNEADFLKNEKIYYYDQEMKLQVAEINFSMSQEGFKEIIKQFSNEFEKKVETIKNEYFEKKPKCLICKAIEEFKKLQNKINDSDEGVQNIFRKLSKKMFGDTKKQDDTSLSKEIEIYSNEEIVFLAYIESFEGVFNLPIDHVVIKSYLWEFFDFLYIKRRLYEIIYTWDKDFKELLTEDTKDYKQNGDIFFLYNEYIKYLKTRNNINKKYEKEKYNFDVFKKNPVFDEYFKNYIKYSLNKDIYESLYEADTQAKEIQILVDYLNGITISEEMILKNDLKCPYCSLGSKIQIFVTSQALEKTLEKYETFFEQKMDKNEVKK